MLVASGKCFQDAWCAKLCTLLKLAKSKLVLQLDILMFDVCSPSSISIRWKAFLMAWAQACLLK